MVSRSTFVYFIVLVSLLLISAPAPAVRLPVVLACDDTDGLEGDPGDGVLDPAADTRDAGQVHPQYASDVRESYPWSIRFGQRFVLVPERALPGSPWPIVFRVVTSASARHWYTAGRPPAAAAYRGGRWHDAP